MTVGAVCYAKNAQDRADVEEHSVLSITSSLEGREKMREQSQDCDSVCHTIYDSRGEGKERLLRP